MMKDRIDTGEPKSLDGSIDASLENAVRAKSRFSGGSVSGVGENSELESALLVRLASLQAQRSAIAGSERRKTFDDFLGVFEVVYSSRGDNRGDAFL